MFVRRFAVAFMIGLVATAIVPPPTEAAHTFNAQGTARDGDTVLRISIGGNLDRFGEPGDAGFGVMLFANEPTIENPFNVVVLESSAFPGRTNFVDGDTAPAVVQTDFWAEATGEGFSFRLDGVRVQQVVTARGHYNQYEIEVTMPIV